MLFQFGNHLRDAGFGLVFKQENGFKTVAVAEGDECARMFCLGNGIGQVAGGFGDVFGFAQQPEVGLTVDGQHRADTVADAVQPLSGLDIEAV